jgi:hypothetical protein
MMLQVGWHSLGQAAQTAVFLVFVALIVAALTATAIATFGLLRIEDPRTTIRWRFLEGFGSAAPFSITGAIVGFLAGLSREPAVSALVSAVLSLVGGLVVYIIARQEQGADRATVALTSMTILILIGSIIGSSYREAYNSYVNSVTYQYEVIRREFLTERYRRGLGLPPGQKP